MTDAQQPDAPKAQITDLISAIMDITRRAEAKEEVWEESAALGRQTKTYGDASWLGLGQLANAVTTRYGDGTFSKWCGDVKLDNVTRGRQYRKVVATLGLTRCIDYLAKDISFSFMRTAVYRFSGDPAQSVAFFDTFINRAADAPSPKLPPPKKGTPKPKVLYEAQDTRFISYDNQTGIAQIFIGREGENLAYLDPKQLLHMIVKEVQS